MICVFVLVQTFILEMHMVKQNLMQIVIQIAFVDLFIYIKLFMLISAIPISPAAAPESSHR